jgi:hypothetical protein
MAPIQAIVSDATGTLLHRAAPGPHASPPDVAGGAPIAAAERIAREGA